MNKILLSTHEILNSSFPSVRGVLKKMCGYKRLYILIGIIIFTICSPAFAGTVLKDVPTTIDPSAKYLFYMHGVGIELGGPRAKSYDYFWILKELANRGFVVIGKELSQVRPDMYAQNRASMARGHLLLAYDKSDKICGSCKSALDKMTHAIVTERVLEIGGGHELFNTPKAN